MSELIAHTLFMREALKQAREALDKDEVPVGAVVTYQGKIIARAHNQVEMLKDPTAHAEMLAITQATSALSGKWLTDCSLYVTLEPCAMCAGAMVLARIGHLFFGAWDDKAGACGSVVNIVNHKKLNHRIDVTSGIEAAESGKLLSNFFKKKRRKAVE